MKYQNYNLADSLHPVQVPSNSSAEPMRGESNTGL